MLDRFGERIRVSYSEAERIYLRAAMTLGRMDRRPAFQDIAELSGRTLSQIRDAAYALHSADLAEWAASRPRMLPVRVVPKMASLAPSELKPPSRAALMAGR